MVGRAASYGSPAAATTNAPFPASCTPGRVVPPVAGGAVVTMTASGRDRLLLGYDVDPTKVSVIPHGVTVRAAGPPSARNRRSHLLTWGLLGPGKGIEWTLRALARLRDLD